MNASCEVCGKNGQCFEVHLGGERHVFDTFECAMRAFAPHCASCGVELWGHGIVLADTLYCSYLCAHEHGSQEHEQSIILREQANL